MSYLTLGWKVCILSFSRTTLTLGSLPVLPPPQPCPYPSVASIVVSINFNSRPYTCTEGVSVCKCDFTV